MSDNGILLQNGQCHHVFILDDTSVIVILTDSTKLSVALRKFLEAGHNIKQLLLVDLGEKAIANDGFPSIRLLRGHYRRANKTIVFFLKGGSWFLAADVEEKKDGGSIKLFESTFAATRHAEGLGGEKIITINLKNGLKDSHITQRRKAEDSAGMATA